MAMDKKASISITLFAAIISSTSTLSVGSFESLSPDYDGPGSPTVTVCSGDEVILICQHNIVSNRATRWTFTPSFPNCPRRVIDHNNPTSVSPCGPFSFHNVTGVSESPTELSSTGVALANDSINGLIIQCWDSERDDANEVGNLILCVIGQPEVSGNISIINMTNGIEIYWNPVVYEDCAANVTVITYDISVTASMGQFTGSVTSTSETSAVISGILPNQEYIVSVTVMRGDPIGNNSCYIGKYPDLTLPSKQTTVTDSESDSELKLMVSVSIILCGYLFQLMCGLLQ